MDNRELFLFGQYLNGDFAIKINGNDKFFIILLIRKNSRFNDYELTIYICEGTEEEKLEWFKVINIAGETLTNQELVECNIHRNMACRCKELF